MPMLLSQLSQAFASCTHVERADQFIAMSSYAALMGRPLDATCIQATVDLLLQGIALSLPADRA